MFRIKMNLENPNNPPLRQNLSSYFDSIAPKYGSITAPSKSVNLKAPMIDRVHKAKSGCSACGKKVA